MLEPIFFTVVHPQTGADTARLMFRSLPTGVRLDTDKLCDGPLIIDRQQMFELGSLLLALSAGEYDDADSAYELLTGYGKNFYLHGKEAASDLQQALQEDQGSEAPQV
jgi:hypothetical protein